MPIKFDSVIIWMLRLLAAGIMFQTLFFKFSAAEESVYIFSAIGMEPWGRIGIGILEFVAVVLILNLRTIAFGAVLGMGLMAGAIFFHLTILGIVVKDDGGQLFIYALLVFLSCFALAVIFRKDLYFFMGWFSKQLINKERA
jgi:hypothetical protein